MEEKMESVSLLSQLWEPGEWGVMRAPPASQGGLWPPNAS